MRFAGRARSRKPGYRRLPRSRVGFLAVRRSAVSPHAAHAARGPVPFEYGGAISGKTFSREGALRANRLRGNRSPDGRQRVSQGDGLPGTAGGERLHKQIEHAMVHRHAPCV